MYIKGNAVLIVIIIASLIGASNIGAWQISLWNPNEGIKFFSLIIFPIACGIGLIYYIWENSKRLRDK